MSKTFCKEALKSLRTFRAAASMTDEAIHNFYQSLDCPKSLACWLLYKHKEYQQLVQMDVNPLDYNTFQRFRDDYTATCFLAKADFLPLEVSKKDAAIDKFRKFETLCSETNNRFRFPLSDPQNMQGQNSYWLNATKRKIEKILGDFDPDEFVDSAYWGPGVSTLLKGDSVSAENKFQHDVGITRDLYDFVSPWFSRAYPSWDSHIQDIGGVVFQDGNEVVTVPKNSKTDRVIAVEPGLNLWFQKGIGTMIRRRLRRVGIDLNSQARNASLAKVGSLDSSLATIDFSSASDSISTAVVRELLPPRWFSLLDACRSKIGRFDKTLIRWNKFSSMGNGFTFELESLIFFAMAYAVAESGSYALDNISVYGDDVIIPNECVESFSSFSLFLGFVVNKEKSFSSSYFRESCGAHFFDGSDCKPIYLKKRLSNVQTLYKLANSVRDLSHRRNSYYGCDSRFRTCWVHLYHGCPKPFRLKTSRGFGDSGFVVNFDEATPVLAKHGIEGYYALSVLEVGLTRPFDSTGLLLARVAKGSEREYGNTYTLRGRTKIRVSRVLVQRWYNMGGWF